MSLRRQVVGIMAVVVMTTGSATHATEPRFLIAGDGTLTISSAHSGERATLRYRRTDGSYDLAALARVRHLFRSRDGSEGEVALRLVELLSWLQRANRGAPITIQSGYRSPGYNAALKEQGRAVATSSLHSEGLAADIRLPGVDLARLWHELRDRECCGAGYYAHEGFVHVDVGPSRFWEAATSRVDENLSAGNARLFARSEYDRYQPGDTVELTLHALTGPPVEIVPRARFIDDGGEPPREIMLEAEVTAPDGCLLARATGVRLRAKGVVAGRGHLELETCAPRSERTPAQVSTNVLEVQ